MVVSMSWIAGAFVTADWSAQPDQDGAMFGLSVDSAGDVNGDGFADVMVGAWLHDDVRADEGRVAVYLGSATGLGSAAAWSIGSAQAFAHLGYELAGAGDINGDGFDDIAVTALHFDNGQVDEGRVQTFHGSALGLDLTPTATLEPDQTLTEFGWSMSFAGDVNGDGFADLVVGAPLYDNGEVDEGAAFLYLGSATGLDTTPAWTAECNQSACRYGSSVASAGDVNGDGFDDVLIGAYDYDGGETDEGQASLFLGSASGLSTLPSWSVESDQLEANLGKAVASAGDVNGDGFDDVIIGAPQFDEGENGEGRAWLYLGSANGLETVAVWIYTSNDLGGLFGWSADSAGDFNADGYDDVVVGGFSMDHGPYVSGEAFVFLGNATGLDAVAVRELGADQPVSYFGYFVAGAGDVDADGYDDILVGAPYYEVDEQDEGWAFLYNGECADIFDSDGDGIGDACESCPGTDPDDDGDGICVPEDCDDDNAAVYPGAPELCDGLDTSCSGSIPADEIDEDGDGEPICAGDCDDLDPEVFSARPDTCSGRDDNCDGELSPEEMDRDGDGASMCGGDCDDEDDRTGPGQIEVCADSVDNDCDEEIDEGCATAGDGVEAPADSGCSGCNGAGGAGGASLLALTLLLLRRSTQESERAAARARSGVVKRRRVGLLGLEVDHAPM